MEPQKSSTIHINPKFKNAYINPNFLKNNATQIHLNPKFLQISQQSSFIAPQQVPATQNKPTVSGNASAIIKNTKRSLIRAPVILEKNDNQQQNALLQPMKKQNLIKISNTKLIKASQLMEVQQKENELIKNVTKEMKNPESVYKLDRRKQHQSGSLQRKRTGPVNNLTTKKR